MKVTLHDLTTIDCTVDEYEELIARGLVGKKLDDLKVELEGQDGEKIVIPSPKRSSIEWADCVPLYGCRIPSVDHLKLGDELTFQFDPTKLKSTSIDCIQNTDSTVSIKENKEQLAKGQI
jgi:hypothetical protein